jgi:type I restriction enzyme S subunit
MICVSEYEMKIIQTILREHAGDCEARAFGSRYKWTAKDYSDLDLAIVGKSKLSLTRTGALRDAFEESDLPFRVDILDWHGISKEFQAIINKGYEVIYPLKESKTSSWPQVRLGDICDKLTKGTTPTTIGCKFQISGVNFIKSESITQNRFLDASKFMYIDKTTQQKLERSQIKENDILFSMAGVYLGKTAIAQKMDIPANTNQAVAIVRIKKIASYLFIYYYLNQSSIIGYINNSVAQSAQPNINLKQIGDISINLPPLPTQCAIATTLSCLDEKIELNNRINANLEAQAQAIFKSWFVDFEPFRGGKFVDSELGKIPEGWKIISFSKFLTERNEKSNDQIIPEYSVTNTGIYPRDETFKKKLSAVTSKNKLAYNTDLVFGMSREILNWGMMKEKIGGFSSAYHIYKVADNIHPLFLESFIKFHHSYFKDLIKPASREGQGVDKSALFSKSVYFPPDNILKEYYTVERILLEDTMINNQQSRTLATIRDALLPKLMGGEIEAWEDK